MVFVRISDGLGNQFFQYATGLALARKLNTRLVLDVTSSYTPDEQRRYELGHFKVTARPWTEREKAWVRKKQRQRERAMRIRNPILQPVRWLRGWCFRRWIFNCVDDQYCGYQPEIFSHRTNIYLQGTWISENYFSMIAAEVRSEFEFATPAEGENISLLQKISNCPAICVHVRRGDYVSNPRTNAKHGLCDVGYYQRGFARIQCDVPHPVVFVFSDDPAWAQANLRFPCETVFVTHNVGDKNHEDIRLMRACQHFIIANSTFSWWAAWLAEYQQKIIIVPARWFRDPKRIDHPAPSSWIRL